jgi:hypothetical protein
MGILPERRRRLAGDNSDRAPLIGPHLGTENNMKQLIPLGAILAVIGLILLAYPFFTTQQTKEVAHVGPLHVDENEQQTHVVPPILSGGVLAVGVVLLAGGLVNRE